MSDRCTGRAQPRTTPLHGRYDHITTSARHITLAPPLSRWIHLVRKDDASCHLGGHAGAWHSSEPACTACCQKKWQQGQCNRPALGSHAGRQASIASGRTLGTTSACKRAPSGLTRPPCAARKGWHRRDDRSRAAKKKLARRLDWHRDAGCKAAPQRAVGWGVERRTAPPETSLEGVLAGPERSLEFAWSRVDATPSCRIGKIVERKGGREGENPHGKVAVRPLMHGPRQICCGLKGGSGE